MMVALQWLGFAGIVAGTWYYGTRPFAGAVLTAVGCVPLAIWASLLEPRAYGSLAVQTIVMIISVRNASRYW
jgi:hypothetical protein